MHKTTKEKEGQEAKSRKREGGIHPCEECVSYPCPDRCSVRVCCFWDQICSFRRFQKAQSCLSVMVWGSVLCLTSWQEGSVEKWIDCPTVPNPFPRPLPSQPFLSSCCL